MADLDLDAIEQRCAAYEEQEPTPEGDAEFIDRAVADIPALVAEVRRLRTERDAICEADVRILEEVNATLAQVTEERDAARAELARVRPVVEAVRAYTTDDNASFEPVERALATLDAEKADGLPPWPRRGPRHRRDC